MIICLVAAAVSLPLPLTPSPAAGAQYTIVGWNNLGMHCMDADYSVFSILPPYNTINAQLIDSAGHLVVNVGGLTVTYEAVADSTNSINTGSSGKTNFWNFTLPLFGLTLPANVGLPVPGPNSFAMPGPANIPQQMSFDPFAQWFAAFGIPITPYDDAFFKNPYPMMRVVARTGTTELGSLDVVLPVSDEMDCRACHGSNSGNAAKPAAGWVNNVNAQVDYRLNILRLHDELQVNDPTFQVALATNHFSPKGLFDTATRNAHSILCASCHSSEALPGSGLSGIKPLTQAVHSLHANVIDPTNGRTLDSSDNRSACYRCHPGSETRCLRGAMGSAVASNGSLAMQCQSCHGSMNLVGASTRTGWLNEPNCQACHSGTALNNSGAIRFTSAFDSPGHMRVPLDMTFATNANTPAPGLSLFRFSRGHGGLYCEACHGSTHAEFPSFFANDNVQSIQHQGHVGVLVECESCHGIQPNTVTGGPHGLHPLGQTWVSQHPDVVESSGAAQCRTCHGADYRGTVLSRSQADRTINAFGTKNFWRGFQIGCYTCHNGPGSDQGNPNRAPVALGASVSTAANVPLAIPLRATDADGNGLTLRVVSQARHGTVGLAGTAATYFPESNYRGADSFTFAAWDGQTDSNLATVQINVTPGPRLENLSTRAQVLTGNDVAIGGFIIGGTDGKTVLLRALGPTLGQPPFNVPHTLADPTLVLHRTGPIGNDIIVATNNNWKDTQQNAIVATGKAPPNDAEAAILQTLPPGNYTAILNGAHNTTGIGLAEIYEIDTAGNSLLQNISTRGFVGTDNSVIIGGLITTGNSTQVVMRALGPTLGQAPFNVPGTLSDPVLGIYDANGTAIGSNDNWQQTQAAELTAAGLAPPNPLESAIIVTRPAGNTTAIVRGKNGATGLALIEIYYLP